MNPPTALPGDRRRAEYLEPPEALAIAPRNRHRFPQARGLDRILRAIPRSEDRQQAPHRSTRWNPASHLPRFGWAFRPLTRRRRDDGRSNQYATRFHKDHATKTARMPVRLQHPDIESQGPPTLRCQFGIGTKTAGQIHRVGPENASTRCKISPHPPRLLSRPTPTEGALLKESVSNPFRSSC